MAFLTWHGVVCRSGGEPIRLKQRGFWMYGRTIAAVSLACALLGSSLPAQAQPMPTYDPDGRYSGGQTSGRRYELFGGMSYAGSIRRETVTAPGKYAPGTIIVNTIGAAALSHSGQRHGAQIRHRRRPHRLHLGRHHARRRQEGMAGLDAAVADAQAPARSAALHEGRAGQSARRARDVSRLLALPHPRLERAGDDRPGRFVGLLPPDERRRDRPLQPREGRRDGVVLR